MLVVVMGWLDNTMIGIADHLTTWRHYSRGWVQCQYGSGAIANFQVAFWEWGMKSRVRSDLGSPHVIFQGIKGRLDLGEEKQQHGFVRSTPIP